MEELHCIRVTSISHSPLSKSYLFDNFIFPPSHFVFSFRLFISFYSSFFYILLFIVHYFPRGPQCNLYLYLIDYIIYPSIYLSFHLSYLSQIKYILILFTYDKRILTVFESRLSDKMFFFLFFTNYFKFQFDAQIYSLDDIQSGTIIRIAHMLTVRTM